MIFTLIIIGLANSVLAVFLAFTGDHKRATYGMATAAATFALAGALK